MKKRAFLGAASLMVLSSMAFSGGVLAQDDRDHQPIEEIEVIEAQNAWGKGIVEIGTLYQNHGDYKAKSSEMLDDLYGFDDGIVLFKPTKAAKDQFRGTKEEAMSYFVGGVNHEDHGFAIQPWSKVRFENEAIDIDKDSANAMGNYYFTDAKTGKEVKVEFSFVYHRDDDGHLVIDLHHSSLPYAPVAH